MAYSFRGHTFLAARPGDMWMPQPPPARRVESRSHIPYSDINLVEDAGADLRTWSLTVYVTGAELANLLADQGQVGTLVTPDATLTNCKLSQIGAKSTLHDRSLYSLEVEFILG